MLSMKSIVLKDILDQKLLLSKPKNGRSNQNFADFGAIKRSPQFIFISVQQQKNLLRALNQVIHANIPYTRVSSEKEQKW